MGLGKWDIPTLRKNLSDMERFLHEAGNDKLSPSPVLRERGKVQYPILAKVVCILGDELNDRLRDAEEREYLGRTIEEIEKREAKDAALFEALHPQLLRANEVNKNYDCYSEEAVRQANEQGEFEQAQYAEGDAQMLEAAVGSPPAQDPILRAMKEAAWSALQRLGTDVLVEYLELWVKKHHDYGPENHAIWGTQGCVIRATDKLMRLKRWYFDSMAMQNEPIEDTWLDLIGYGLIGLVIKRGQWPVTTLSEAMESMEGKLGDDAFEYVIADMKTAAEASRDPSCCFLGRMCGKSPHGPAGDCPLRRMT